MRKWSTVWYIETAVMRDGFHCGIWYDDELVGVIGLHYLDLVNKRTSIGYYLAKHFQKKES